MRVLDGVPRLARLIRLRPSCGYGWTYNRVVPAIGTDRRTPKSRMCCYPKGYRGIRHVVRDV